MSKTDPNLRGRLAQAPTYQAALRGEWFLPGMPQTPGFRVQHLRAAAQADGVTIPSGYAFDQGSNSFEDANADHWYSDPRVLGPIAVGAATAGAGLLGAPAAAAPAAAAAPGSIAAPTAAQSAAGIASMAGSGLPAAAGAGAAPAASSWLSNLANPRNILQAAGPALNAYSQGQAHNRGTEFEGQLDLERELTNRDDLYQRQLISREQEGRTSGADAWRRLLAAQHTLSPGARPQLSPYSIAPRQATDMERQGATAMSDEVMQRLQGGNPIPVPTQRPLGVNRNLLRPSTSERTLGWLGPIASAASRWL